ncbi:MAG: DNRLRE domain-containing protein [Chloroflexaceae bacterium]|jgi:plastocyanin|nr:DNRLRE domain-containing protein [Chloroflexaceae bacterium]
MKHTPPTRSALWSIVLLLLVLAGLLPALPARAATPLTTELYSVGDARVQGGSPDVNFGSGFIWTGTANGHLAYVQFDMLELPLNATITSAELRLSYQGTYTGTANVEVGRNDAAWDEATVTWNTRPASSFNGNIQPVGDTRGDIAWPVTPLVTQWHTGTAPNYGFALRGDGLLKAFHSKETGCIPTPTAPCDPLKLAPRLVVTYTLPAEEGPRPDLGDAPDSSNNVGVNPNTAYPGVPGNFPTVWNGTPAGDAAGPRHANPSFQGILGQNLSREVEADNGNDADGLNNILNGGADNANNDRADDGWRNRNASFANCQATTLRVRVKKAAGANIERMFLNVWFDGNRDGDWADRALCQPEAGALNIPAHEWIVQNYFVDMAGIPAGGYVDIDVPTEIVLNSTPERYHWMRFTLSERHAPENANGRTDGRGPHPSVGSYQFGETEDYVQWPQPPGEDGTLEIQKRIVNASGDPLPIGGMVTYEIRLRHVGGSQPMQARLRDELAYGFRLFPQIVNGQIEYIVARSATGGAAPLQASYDLNVSPPLPLPTYTVNWQGTLVPDSEITLSFLVQNLGLCEPNITVQDVRNVAQAQPRNGTPISAEATFRAACPNYNPLDIEFEQVPFDADLSLDELNDLTWNGTVWNNHPISTTINLYQSGANTIIQDNTTLNLGPNERRQISFNLKLNEGDKQLADLAQLKIGFCFVLPETEDCPDKQNYPNYHGELPPVDAARPDLGDAPDSTNHAGVAMLAFPGVQANYPTVFDPATGNPEGPKHNRPWPLHLGPQVSRELEADVGPDQDPLNNIEPAANDPNNDRFDDGANPNLWALNNCQTTNLPVRVAVNQQAVDFFKQQERRPYLNVWLDANRDGDWADGLPCGGGPDGGGQGAVEHIVIDVQVDVVALGPGLHVINVPTGRVPWPADLANKPTWVRLTLSERESNKPLQYGNIKYGDGRGYAQPFGLGETEDYLMYPNGAEGAGPDLAVGLRGKVTTVDGKQQLGFKIDYANLGSRPASGGTLRFQLPSQLRDLEISMLQAPGIPSSDISKGNGEVTMRLPTMQPGEQKSVLIGLLLPASGAATASTVQATEYSARAEVTLAGDTDGANNQATATVKRTPATPTLAFKAAKGQLWSGADSTCRNSVEVGGMGEPGSTVELLLNGKPAGNAPVGGDGLFTATLQNLPNGLHIVSPRDAASGLATGKRLHVNNSLPIDPLSLVFTDSKGQKFHPQTLGYSFGATQTGSFFKAGETYQMGVDGCGNNRTMQIRLLRGEQWLGMLSDEDGDGHYSGSFTYEAAAPQLATTVPGLTLAVSSGSSSQRFTLAQNEGALGYVRDAATRQPLADASVTLLAAGVAPWPAGSLGLPNPQISAADGSYMRVVPGASQVSITRSGYQPFRSWVFDESGSIDATSFLTAVFAGPAAQSVGISESGFDTVLLRVPAGSVVEWVNLGLGEHGISGTAGASGALNSGQSFRLRFDAAGTFTFSDPANPTSSITVVVEEGGRRIFLPLVRR